MIEGDNREAGRHRFQIDQAEAFMQRCRHIGVGAVEYLPFAGFLNPTGKHHALSKLELAGKLGERLTLGTVADDDQIHFRTVRSGQCFEELINPFSLHQPAHCHRNKPVVR